MFDKQTVYKAYGDIVSEVISLNQAYKYTGKPLDSERGINHYYFGARYYDPSFARWLSPDPAAGKYPGLSPYVYCESNPLALVDRNGKWPKGIHDAIIDEALSDFLSSEEIAAVKGGSAYADEFQAAKYSYMHAMRESGQTADEAEQKMNGFIEDKSREFVNHSGNQAFKSFGMAIHPLMDKYSPSHTGFQVWRGFWGNPIGAAMHWIREQYIKKKLISQIAGEIRLQYLTILKEKETFEEQPENIKGRWEDEYAPSNK